MKKVEIVKHEEGVAQIRVASLARHFPDDIQGECSMCQRDIFYRPHPPFLLPFICLECALPLMGGESEIKCTEEAARLFLGRTTRIGK